MKNLEIEPINRISTRTRVKGKNLVSIQVSKIKPTNAMDWSIKKIIDSPICLIRDAEKDCYYIADGNHRFFTKLLVQKIKFLNAWVLEEGDQERLHGNPLPTRLEDWKNGVIDLHKLCLMAREAYNNNEYDIKKDLELCGRNIKDDIKELESFALSPKKIQEIDLKNLASEERDLKTLALTFAQSVLNLIEGKTSFKEEASVLNTSEEELSSLYKCFIDGGIEAIRERLKKDLKPK